MKRTKIIYWVTTGLISLLMSFSALSYFLNPEVREGFHHLGFSDSFRVELAVAKILGVLVLLLPVPARIKEWAYAGFAITFISAFIAHLSAGDPMGNAIAPIIIFLILIASYVQHQKLINIQ